MICDAGGGTVDLISYEITSLHPLELKELVPGKGELELIIPLPADCLLTSSQVAWRDP